MPDESPQRSDGPAGHGGRSAGAGPAEASAARRDLLDLVAAALEGLEREGPAFLEALCREHPAQAEALRERVGLLRGTGFVEERIPERLGEFRLLKRLGDGGMGVVYLAEQERPRRHVALKLVRPEQLFFPGARDRFEREIEAVARLSHPGIVPVFTHGEAEGLPYFAMELVAGASLEDVVRELHGRAPDALTGADLRRIVEERAGARTAGEAAERLFGGGWASACLRIARQVAEALQHAHERGVLHRDIKPSNLMLTPDGRALLLDFGLAAAEGSQRLTATGARLGSLAYMSPEQLRGERPELDARTDVYSLGVTLYELLALRAPFGSPTTEETRARILAGEPVAPRALNPTLSRDAETVVLKAMDPEPARRYASAAAFADDLARALDLRPVSARRTGAWLRARRWAQRRPALATALVAGALLLVGGPLGFGLQQRRAAQRIEEQRDLARAAEALAQEQAQRARDNLAHARDAVETMLTQVAEEDLLAIPQLEPVRRRLLEQALAFSERFVAENAGDGTLLEETARAAHRVGFLELELGRTEEALAALARAEGIEREALEAAPDEESWTELLAGTLSARAKTLFMAGRDDEAREAAERSLAFRRERAARRPDDLDALRRLDESQGLIAALLLRRGETAEAEAAHREHVAVDERWVEAARGTPQEEAALVNLVIARNNLGQLLLEQGLVDEALEVLERAGSELEGLDVAAMRQLIPAQGLATALSNLGRARWAAGQRESALGAMRRAAAWTERIHARSPAFPELKRLLGSVWSNLGVKLATDPATRDEAESAFARAEEVARELRALTPEPPGARVGLASVLINRASLLRDLGRGPEAVRRLEEAVSLAREHRAAEAGADGLLSGALQHLAHARRTEGDLAGCVEAAEELAAHFPRNPTALRIAAGYVASCVTLAAPDTAPIEPARVEAWLDRAMELLGAALDAGLEGADALRNARDLHALHALPRFAERIDELAARERGAP